MMKIMMISINIIISFMGKLLCSMIFAGSATFSILRLHMLSWVYPRVI